MHIVILDGYTVNPGDLTWAALETLGDLTVHERTPQEQVIAAIGAAEVVFTCKNRIDAKILDACPQLKFIGELATGYDNIDLAAAKAHDVAVCNVPGYSTEAVAQHTFALLLEIANGVGFSSRAVHQGQWCKSPDFCMVTQPLIQLYGKSLGIIGYGHIGRRVAEIAKTFGMTIHVYSQDREAAIKSDVVSLHCPATAENIGFINRDFFRQMKDGAILLNTARGALINEADLAEALRSGKLAAAAVDVVNGEPMRPDCPLLGVPNLYITPHVAWATQRARSIICETSAKNLQSFLDGGSLNRIV